MVKESEFLKLHWGILYSVDILYETWVYPLYPSLMMPIKYCNHLFLFDS